MLQFPAGGGPTAFAQTTASGSYAFRDIAEQAWTIQPSLFGELDGSVNEMDAATILAAASGEIILAAEQMVAGDVSGNGSISATDASFILQRATGMTSGFPVTEACESDWVFFPNPGPEPPLGTQTITEPVVSAERCVPGSITLDPLVGEIEGRDFTAAAFGDVDSSWVSARAGEGAQSDAVVLGRPFLRGSTALVPIELESRTPFRALHLVILYDPDALVFASVRPGPESRDANALVVANDHELGKLVVGAASATMIEADQPFTLEFELIRPGRYPDIEIIDAQLGPL